MKMYSLCPMADLCRTLVFLTSSKKRTGAVIGTTLVSLNYALDKSKLSFCIKYLDHFLIN